jgi:putative transposase
MSRSGNCWDNVAMESFFSSVKTERPAQDVSEAGRSQGDVFDYVERFYNSTAALDNRIYESNGL